MDLLKKVGIFIIGCVVLIGIGTLPDIVSNISNENQIYKIPHKERWFVNVEVDSTAGHDTAYFYTSAIIEADSIKELTLPTKQLIRGLKSYYKLDDHDEIDASNKEGIEYVIKLIKQQK